MAKISIVVPVYNSEKTIKDTIESVLSQSYKNYESSMKSSATMYIIDNGYKNKITLLFLYSRYIIMKENKDEAAEKY